MLRFQADQRLSLHLLSIVPCTRPGGRKLCSPSTCRPERQRYHCLRTFALRGIKRAGAQQLVQPQQAHLPLSNVPIWFKAPLALAALVAAYQLMKRFRNNTGSITQLESRGLIDEDRHGSDPFYSDMMKNVNTVQMEELSKDQIDAARARRLKERESWKVDIDDIVLPDNHPFAVKKPVSKEDEELVAARLQVRKGLPLQDLSGRRGLPDDGKGAAGFQLEGEAQAEGPASNNIVRRPRVSAPGSPGGHEGGEGMPAGASRAPTSAAQGERHTPAWSGREAARSGRSS